MLENMSITEIKELIKRPDDRLKRDLFVLAVIILTAIGAFALGRLSVQKQESLQIIQNHAQGQSSLTVPVLAHAPIGQMIASKTGSTYYFPWCTSAQHIKEGSQVWLASAIVAQNAGYHAGNCKGLQ